MVSCLKTEQRPIQAVSPGAVFYFERVLKKLALQRRRWINGTIAGHLFLLINWRWIWDSKFPITSKIMILFLILGQLMIYGIVAIAPAIFLFSLRYLIFVVAPTFQLECNDTDDNMSTCTIASGFTVLPDMLWILIFFIYGFFAMSHSREGSNNIYKHYMFFILMIVGAITVFGSMIGVVKYFFDNTHTIFVTSALSIVVIIMVHPLITSALVSPVQILFTFLYPIK